MERYLAFWAKIGKDADGNDRYRIFYSGEYCHLYTAQICVDDKPRARIVDRTNGTIYERFALDGGWHEVRGMEATNA